jgi:uncharacterized protein
MRDRVRYIAYGFGIGIVSGLLGIAGGAFLIPVMTGYCSLDQRCAQATSLVIVIPSSIMGCIIYAAHGNIDYGVASYLVVGSMVGAYLGAKLMCRIPEQHLRRLFSCMLLLIGLKMVMT